MTDAADRKPFWAKCPSCGYCWPAAYLPMEMATCARLIGRAACPMCGVRKHIQIAKQTEGVLEEPQ